jgi:hypothetical protein
MDRRTGRGEVYSKQEDRTKSKGGGWTGGQIGERSTVNRRTEQKAREGDGQEDR